MLEPIKKNIINTNKQNSYKESQFVESYLFKKKKNINLRQKFTKRYFKFCLIENSFSYRDSAENPEIKKIHIGKDLKGFDENLSEEDKKINEFPFGFYLYTSVRKYTLFTDQKEIYTQWMRILNFHFRKIDKTNLQIGLNNDKDINKSLNKIDNNYNFMDDEDIEEIKGDRSPTSQITNIFDEFNSNNLYKSSNNIINNSKSKISKLNSKDNLNNISKINNNINLMENLIPDFNEEKFDKRLTRNDKPNNNKNLRKNIPEEKYIQDKYIELNNNRLNQIREKNNRSNSVSGVNNNLNVNNHVHEKHSELNFDFNEINSNSDKQIVDKNYNNENIFYNKSQAMNKLIDGFQQEITKKYNVIYVKPNQALVYLNDGEFQINSSNKENNNQNIHNSKFNEENKIDKNTSIMINKEIESSKKIGSEYRSKTPNKKLIFDDDNENDEWMNFEKKQTFFAIKNFNQNSINNQNGNFNIISVNNQDNNEISNKNNFSYKEVQNQFVVNYKMDKSDHQLNNNLTKNQSKTFNESKDVKANLINNKLPIEKYRYNNSININYKNSNNDNKNYENINNQSLINSRIQNQDIIRNNNFQDFADVVVNSKIKLRENDKSFNNEKIFHETKNNNAVNLKFKNGENVNQSNLNMNMSQNKIKNNKSIDLREKLLNKNGVDYTNYILQDLKNEDKKLGIEYNHTYKNNNKDNYRSKSENKIIDFNEKNNVNKKNSKQFFNIEENDNIIDEANNIVSNIKEYKNILYNQDKFESNWDYEKTQKANLPVNSNSNKPPLAQSKKQYVNIKKNNNINLFDDPNLHIRVAGNNKKLALENLHFGEFSKPVSSFNDLIPVPTKTEQAQTFNKYIAKKKNEDSLTNIGNFDLSRKIKISGQEEVNFIKNISQTKEENFVLNFVVPEQLVKNTNEVDRIKVIKDKIQNNMNEKSVYLGKLKNISINNTSMINNTNINVDNETSRVAAQNDGNLEQENTLNNNNLDIVNIKGNNNNKNNLTNLGNYEKSLLENPNQRLNVAEYLKKVPDKKAVYTFNKNRPGIVDGIDLNKYVIYDEHHTKITKTYKVEEYNYLGDDFHIPHTEFMQKPDGELKVELNLENLEGEEKNYNNKNSENNPIKNDDIKFKNENDNSMMGNEISRITRHFSLIQDDDAWDYSVIDDDFSLNDVNINK